VTVVSPVGDFELGTGSLLIGRLPECDVILEDSLVSRMHARLSVQNDAVVIEDLHSTNGVYVNEQRVGYSVVVREHDRILIGATEIAIYESRDSSAQPVPGARSASPPPEGRATPTAHTLEFPVPSGASGKRQFAASTARADALRMIGGVAERLAATGNFEAAAHVMSGHLRRILKGANSGLMVHPDLADAASRWALRVARWINEPLWVDYVVELHLCARLVMSGPTLAAFEGAILELGCDRVLLRYYVQGQGRAHRLHVDEEHRFTRLKFLTRE
jgi:pSer/pThr/pTyr-binding forkhead associated (FHA) protein